MPGTRIRVIFLCLAANTVLPAQPPPAKYFGIPEPAPSTTPQAQGSGAQFTADGGMLLKNFPLIDFIDVLAKRLKINYVLDPAVGGSVNVFTQGAGKPVDEMQLLETMLRVNGAAMVKTGDLYRIVPVARVSQLPLTPVITLDTSRR